MAEFTYVDPMEGLIKGHSFVNGLFDQAAQLAAGKAYQRGDKRGAAGLLASRGDFKGADALNNQATASDVLTAADTGNYGAARTAAAQAGDPALYTATRTAEDQDRAQRLEWMGHATDALLQIPAERRAQAYQQLAPTLQAMGLPADQIAQLGSPENLTDEHLKAFQATLGQMGAMDIQTTPDGDVLGIDKKTGQVKVLHHSTPKPIVAAPGSGIFTYGEDGSVQAMGGAPAGGAGSAATAAPTKSGPVYDRIAQTANAAGAKPEEVGYLNRLAQVESSGRPNARNGSSTGLFQFHPDTFAGVLPGGDINNPDDQTKAALALSRRDRQALGSMGVPATDVNAYILHQQGAAGGRALLTAPPETNAIAALTPVYGSEKVARKAIVNNGGSPDMTAGQFVDMWRQKWGGGAAAAAAPATPPANGGGAGWHLTATVPDRPKEQWEQLPDGRQKNTLTGKIEGTATVDPPPLGDPNLTGEAFLKSLPAQDQRTIKLMVQGKVPPPSGLAISKPQVQARIAAAAQYDPTFDESKWKARVQTRADVATGQTHRTIQQLGTVMSHLDDLDKSVKALGNTPFGLMNKASNVIEGAIGQPMVAEFNINKTLAAQELRKYFAGGSGGSLEELRSLEDQLDASKSPSQLHGVIRRIVMLVGDKKEEIEKQYTDVMGEPLNIDNQLTPKALEAYRRLGGEAAPAPRAKPSVAAKADPLGIR